MGLFSSLFGSFNNKVNSSDYDWIDRHPSNHGRTYYGSDDGEGHTDWYDEDGNLDCSTDTPSDEDEYTERVPHDGQEYDD